MTHIARLFKDLIHRVCSPPPVGIPAYLRIIRNPTVKVLDFVQFGGPTLGRPSHKRRDGRPFRGDPRAPSLTPKVCRGTGSSGYSTDLWLSPEQVSGTPSSRHAPIHSASGPKPPAAFPLGTAAGSWFRRTQPPASRTHRRPYPWGSRCPDQGDRSPRGRRPNPHLRIHMGVPQLEPDRFHPYPRACPDTE